MAKNKLWEWPFSTTLHRKKENRLSGRLVQLLVFSMAKLWTSRPITKKVIYNGTSFQTLIENRIKETQKKGCNTKPLITIVNHQSCIDDPLVWGVLSKWRHVFSGQFRWIPVAAEFCFTNRLYSFMFSNGRCVPVLRGLGVYQQGVDFCIDKLNEGQWVSIFPEGKINIEQTRRLKWGVGRLIAECNTLPDVIPIWVLGMNDVLPNKRPYIPQIRQTVAAYVGDPIQLKEVLTRAKDEALDPMATRKLITDCIESEFWKVKEQAISQHKQWLQCNRSVT